MERKQQLHELHGKGRISKKSIAKIMMPNKNKNKNQVEKTWFPLHVNRKEEGETEQEQTYQFTQGYNILHILRVHHLTLTFIIHNKYISTLYLYTL